MSTARAEIEITASDSKLSAGLARARGKIHEWSAAMARGMGKAMSGAAWVNKKTSPGATAKHALGEAAGTLATRGLDSMLGAADGVRDFERSLVRLGIAGNLTNVQIASLRTAIQQTSKDTAISASDILAGAQTYVDLTGDIKGAKTAMVSFARIAQATGASTADVATATSALQMSMRLDSSQAEAAFSGLIVQGKDGAVGVKDFAGELAGLAPQFAQFKGGTGLSGIRELGAAFQVIRIGAKDSSVAATQFQALMGEIGKSGKELSQIGISVFEKDGKSLRGASDIFEQIAKNKQLASVATMEKIFGRKESQLAVLQLRAHIDKFRELKEAGKDTTAVQRDMATFLESDAGRLDKAFNSIKVAIAEAFTPERITGFTNAVEALADKLGPVIESVGWIGDKLGGLYGAGQKVRGFLSGNENQNPFVEGNGMEEAQKYADAMDSDPEKQKKNIQALVLRSKNKQSYDTAVTSIMGGQVNDRSSPESIRRAVLAKYNTREAGQGHLGEEAAGSAYLKNANIDNAKAAEYFAKYQTEAVQAMAKAIRDGLAGMRPPAVNMDSTKVDKAVKAGSVHARRGGS